MAEDVHDLTTDIRRIIEEYVELQRSVADVIDSLANEASRQRAAQNEAMEVWKRGNEVLNHNVPARPIAGGLHATV